MVDLVQTVDFLYNILHLLIWIDTKPKHIGTTVLSSLHYHGNTKLGVTNLDNTLGGGGGGQQNYYIYM